MARCVVILTFALFLVPSLTQAKKPGGGGGGGSGGASPYNLIVLAPPGVSVDSSWPTDLDENGNVVGGFSSGSQVGSFYYDSTQDSWMTYADGIRIIGLNNSGQLVGHDELNAQTLLWSSPVDTSPHVLTPLPGFAMAFAADINDVGLIIGECFDTAGTRVATAWAITTAGDVSLPVELPSPAGDPLARVHAVEEADSSGEIQVVGTSGQSNSGSTALRWEVGVYRKDLQTDELELVDVGFFEEVSLSADGRYVAYDDDYDVFVKDMDTGDITLASAAADGTPANDGSSFSRISADGRYVAFSSYADNLVANDANGWTSDIFVKDLVTGDVQLVSSAADGTAGNDAAFRPTLTPDGRFVAFQSYASNLVAEDTNGNGADVSFVDIQQIEIKLGLGDDRVTAFALNLSGGLEVNLGDGDDALEILRGDFVDLDVDAGSGVDRVTIESASFDGSSDIRMDKGSDILLLQDSSFEEDVRLDGGLDDDLLQLLSCNYFASKQKVKRFETTL